jgi:predicted TIM-barrel fold metal-dependent hydrolase
LTYEGNVEWFVKESGSKKVLFGTDMPFFDPRPAFGRLALANISDDEKRDVFGLNMARILKFRDEDFKSL